MRKVIPQSWGVGEALASPKERLKSPLPRVSEGTLRKSVWILVRTILLFPILFISAANHAYSSPYPIPSHHIKLEFDLKTHTLKGIDRLRTSPDKNGEVKASIHSDVNILSVKGPDDRELEYSLKENSGEKKSLTISLPSSTEGDIWIQTEYKGIFKDLPGDIKFSREFITDRPVAYVGEEIILLDAASCWYLCIEGSATFAVTTTTPPGYEVVMEGTRLVRKVEEEKIITIWSFPHPSTGPYLVGGRYTITEDKYNNIPIYAYFFPEDVNLSSTYIEYSKKYLALYEDLLGKYPFGKFAVVENILPTGFGMPSYTLLGQSVLRLPFIVKTSLGHEIAHNWWGNYVYPDYESGNWSEGLTTYLSDHLYEEMEGRGGEHRNQILRDYASYVEPAEEYPLTQFKNRVGPEDRAIGYGKGAYVFHMLRVMLGDEAFYNGLRDIIASRGFKQTSWPDFRTAFEKVSGRDLGWFFKQWVEGVGAPEIDLGEIQVQKKDNGAYLIKVEILQRERAYELYLPIAVKTEEGPRLTYHWIKKLTDTVEIEAPSKPVSITIDPFYDVFRRLSPKEIPPAIAKFIGSEKRLIVLPTQAGQENLGAYFKIASGMDSVTVKTDKEVTEEDFKKGAVYLLGGKGENIWTDKILPEIPPDIKIEEETIRIHGKVYDKKDSVLVVAMANPYNPENILLLFSGDNPEYINSAGRRISHYGKYSYLLFVKGENVEKGTWEGERIEKEL